EATTSTRPSWTSAPPGARPASRSALPAPCAASARAIRSPRRRGAPQLRGVPRLCRGAASAGGLGGPVARPPNLEVAAALIQDADGRYLITQRRRGSPLEGLWEFPGGKRDAGEELDACLARELTEELGARFTVGDKVDTIRWDYP